MFAQLRELWSKYGDFAEIWFDGGFKEEWEVRLRQLLLLQPQAVVFNGCARNGVPSPDACVTANPTCWIGTESGFAPDPTWATGVGGNGGASNSSVWCPKSIDTPLQVPDAWNGMGWNYNKTSAVKSLATLIDTYHQSVGHGGTLELAVDMDLDGNPVSSHAVRLQDFGSWIRSCYGTPVAKAIGSYQIVLHPASAVDRVLLSEDLSYGQRVRRYEVLGGADASSLMSLVNGTAIGNKKIDMLVAAGHFKVLLVRIQAAVAVPRLSFAAFAPCGSGTRDNTTYI